MYFVLQGCLKNFNMSVTLGIFETEKGNIRIKKIAVYFSLNSFTPADDNLLQQLNLAISE